MFVDMLAHVRLRPRDTRGGGGSGTSQTRKFSALLSGCTSRVFRGALSLLYHIEADALLSKTGSSRARVAQMQILHAHAHKQCAGPKR